MSYLEKGIYAERISQMGSICLLFSKEALHGAWDRGREASPLFLDTTSVYTLRRLPLFKQKTSWRMMYGRFQRLFHSGEVAAGASSVSGGPQRRCRAVNWWGPLCRPRPAHCSVADQGHQHRPEMLGIPGAAGGKGMSGGIPPTHCTEGTTEPQRGPQS